MLIDLISPYIAIVLPASENGIILRSFVLTQYRRVTDGWTEMQQLTQRTALRRAVKSTKLFLNTISISRTLLVANIL